MLINIKDKIYLIYRMRIALLLQGHFRTFEKTHQTWINALEDCEYDCYFTTWNIIDANTK